MEHVPFVVHQHMWVQHDGLQAHFSQGACEHLGQMLPEKWIEGGGSVTWPAHSPDLITLDFFLWSHVKSLVYQAPVETAEDLL